jgi:hypothetical protein
MIRDIQQTKGMGCIAKHPMEKTIVMCYGLLDKS